jgi:hypothetical protein
MPAVAVPRAHALAVTIGVALAVAGCGTAGRTSPARGTQPRPARRLRRRDRARHVRPGHALGHDPPRPRRRHAQRGREGRGGRAVARLDRAAARLPARRPVALAVDPADPRTAFVAYSGYSATTPGRPGHVFRVSTDAGSARPVVTDLSHDLGDQPVNALACAAATGDLYAATDFGVLRLPTGAHRWQPAGAGLPPVAVTDLEIDTAGRVLVAATYGRGAFTLRLRGS